MAAKCIGTIENSGSLSFRQFEKIRGIKIFDIKWRIFPDNHRIKGFQSPIFCFPAVKPPVIFRTRQFETIDTSMHVLPVQNQIMLTESINPVPSFPRFLHQRKCRILFDDELLKRIRIKSQFHILPFAHDCMSGSVFSSSTEAASNARRAITPYM